MKNKKTLIGIVLLIVVLLLGIGYAAITRELTISGSATANANSENFKVYFTGETEVSNGDNVTATATAETTTANITVTGLTTKDDFETATYTIKNASPELNALLSVTTEEAANSDYFDVKAEIEDEATPLAPDGTTTVTVTVTLIKTPVAEVTSNVTVKLNAEAVVAE